MATYASIKYDMDLSSSATGAGALTLLSTQTASSSATLSFTSGIDSTYKEYIFKIINIHPATNAVGFLFNVSIDSGSNYNVTKTTTAWVSYHKEADTAQGINYQSDYDSAQATGFQNLQFPTISNDNDSGFSGTLHLFNPSSTTFVKHFMTRCNSIVGQSDDDTPYSEDYYVAGYANSTSAVDAIQFKMSSGNIDAGVIKMYGVS